jgi:2-alkyl-3-oxoalkanoate reductase
MSELTSSSGSLSVFISGGSSAAGRALARLLVNGGHKVTATASGSVEAGMFRREGVLSVYPDLLRAGELLSAYKAAKASVYINLAPTLPNQIPNVDPQWERGAALLTQGTVAALEAAKAGGAEYFIQASFAFLGGDDSPHHGHGHDEHDEHDEEEAHDAPSTAFTQAAADAEAMVHASGIPATILRFGFIYGAESPAIVSLREALMRNGRVLLGSGHARANWVQADDAARAVALSVAQRPVGETLNIVDDQPAAPAAFVAQFAKSMGLSAPGQPPALLLKWTQNADVLAMLEMPSGASNAESKAKLGWALKYPSFATGIEQALMVWRATEPIRA